MTDRFRDVLPPSKFSGYPTSPADRFSTDLTAVDSGAESANRRWSEPLTDFFLPEAIRDQDSYNTAFHHWLIMAGPFHTWPYLDVYDFASADPTNRATATTDKEDQSLGTGDGSTTDFQMVRQYSRGGFTQDRTIYLPVLATIEIAINGVLESSSNYSISRPGGVVSFNTAPANLDVLTWGGQFHKEVRFEADDTWQGVVRQFGVSGYANLKLIGMRRCT